MHGNVEMTIVLVILAHTSEHRSRLFVPTIENHVREHTEKMFLKGEVMNRARSYCSIVLVFILPYLASLSSMLKTTHRDTKIGGHGSLATPRYFFFCLARRA